MKIEMLNSLSGQFGHMMERLSAKSKRRAIRKTLLSFDDHLLRDLGLSRHQVLSDEF